MLSSGDTDNTSSDSALRAAFLRVAETNDFIDFERFLIESRTDSLLPVLTECLEGGLVPELTVRDIRSNLDQLVMSLYIYSALINCSTALSPWAADQNSKAFLVAKERSNRALIIAARDLSCCDPAKPCEEPSSSRVEWYRIGLGIIQCLWCLVARAGAVGVLEGLHLPSLAAVIFEATGIVFGNCSHLTRDKHNIHRFSRDVLPIIFSAPDQDDPYVELVRYSLYYVAYACVCGLHNVELVPSISPFVAPEVLAWAMSPLTLITMLRWLRRVQDHSSPDLSFRLPRRAAVKDADGSLLYPNGIEITVFVHFFFSTHFSPLFQSLSVPLSIRSSYSDPSTLDTFFDELWLENMRLLSATDHDCREFEDFMFYWFQLHLVFYHGSLTDSRANQFFKIVTKRLVLSLSSLVPASRDDINNMLPLLAYSFPSFASKLPRLLAEHGALGPLLRFYHQPRQGGAKIDQGVHFLSAYVLPQNQFSLQRSARSAEGRLELYKIYNVANYLTHWLRKYSSHSASVHTSFCSTLALFSLLCDFRRGVVFPDEAPSLLLGSSSVSDLIEAIDSLVQQCDRFPFIILSLLVDVALSLRRLCTSAVVKLPLSSQLPRYRGRQLTESKRQRIIDMRRRAGEVLKRLAVLARA